jgi:nucleoside 2-deoxyribosyltransferase
MKSQAFFAYPGGYPIISEAVDRVVELAEHSNLQVKPWSAMKITGFKVDDLIRDELDDANLLIADVTYANFNVYYEMGYAIGRGKPVLPTINTAVEHAVSRITSDGLFDNIGWATYQNAEQLSVILQGWRESAWVNRYKRAKDHSQPLFFLDCQKKTDFRNHIFQSIENSHVQHRGFDPEVTARLTAAQAISEISASAGVVLPILSDDIVDSARHNRRAAFMLGLSHGFDIDVLALQFGNGPAPLDYRDFITNSTFRGETTKHVTEYCGKVLIWNQASSSRSSRNDLGLLGQIDLGSPTAENETAHLDEYFVKTAEYARAIRAEGAVVTGRKGSGKSAIYFQAVNAFSRDRHRCVIDLRPASHNLSEMRESLLGVVNNTGLFDHTIAAFWQYVIYVEILLKMRELILPRTKNDFSLQERIRIVEEEFSLRESTVAGDFTSRLSDAIDRVMEAINGVKGEGDIRQRVTNLLFEKPIPRLRDTILSFQDFFDEVCLFIDDLDKGWPPLQVEPHDVATIKHLIEVMNKIQRDLGKKRLKMRHIIFLRSDIYERLVEQTSDRGKYNVIKVDWSDPQQLKHLLKQRVVNNLDRNNHDDAWGAVNPVLSSGEEAVDVLIETSLRRPRFLIDICERTLSFAINRGHGFVTEADVIEGARQMSLYLVSDFAYEMRDIAGTPEDIFYAFIGSSELLTEREIAAIVSPLSLPVGMPQLIELLLWYGFLGIINEAGTPVFIYDRAYDFRRLEAERGPASDDVLYAINPAFLAGLRRQ